MSERTPVPLETLLAHRAFVTALARSLVRDPGAADDLAQDAWVVAVEHPPAEGGSVRGWFARVLRNRRRDAWRTDVRRERREATPPQRAADASPDAIVARAEIHRRVVLAVFALEEPARSTVILRYFDGLDATEIAERQGVPAATVRKRLERALDELRTRLDADHGGDRGAWMAALAPLVGMGGAAGAGGASGTGAAAGTNGISGTLGSAASTAGPPRWALPLVAAAAVVLIVVGVGAALVPGEDVAGRGGERARRDGTSADAGERDGQGAAASKGRRPRAARDAKPATDQTRSESGARVAAALEPAADVTVLVRTPTGEPAVGATVTLRRFAQEPPQFSSSYALELPDPPTPALAAEATTGPDGRATLTGLFRAMHVLSAEAAGFAPPQRITFRPGVRPSSWELLLRRSAVVTGRVTDLAAGAPAEAEVVAIAVDEGNPGVRAGPLPFVRTAADGTFRIERVPAGRVVVGARRPGGLVAASTAVDTDGPAKVELRLPAAAVVGGTAVDDASGQPVEGVALDVLVGAQTAGFSPARVRVVSGAAGRFSVPDVPLDSMVDVFPSADASWKPRWNQHCRPHEEARCNRVPPAGRTDLVVRLLRPCGIEGIVRRADGSPAARADVVVIGDQIGFTSRCIGTELARASADAEGRFRVDGLAPGRVEVFARSANEFAPDLLTSEQLMTLSRSSGAEDARPSLVAGLVTTIDLRLVPGRRVVGRVLLQDGSPAAAADVVTGNRHVGGDFAARAVTDVEGRFLLQAIPPGKAPLTVSASLQGAGKGRVEVPDGDAEVTIRLGGAGATDISLAGRIVGPDGEPVPGASLLLVETPGDDDTEPARYSRYLLRGGNRQLPVAADGTFSATGIYGEHRDRFLLVASVRGFLPGGTIVPVRAGATIRDVRVALRRGAEIRGVLRDDAGAPVAGMPVRAARAAPGNWGLGDGPATTATGDDGTFRLVVEPEVSVSIVFGAPGEEVLSLPAALPSTSLVEARLRRGEKSPAARQAELVARAEQARRMARQDEIPADWVRLTGRVVGPDGKPLDRAHVSHVVTDGRARASRGTSTDADGRFSIALPPGAAGTLDVDAQERGVARRLGVAAGAVEIEVRVLPRTEPVLRGVVRDGEGRPVAGAVVICTQDPRGPGALLRRSVDARNEEFERDRRDLRTLRTDADGAFRAATLPFGRWTVYAGRPGTPWFAGALTEVVVEDAAQPTAERDLRVVPGHVLRVRLLDAEGVARRGALVIVTQAKTAPETPIDFIVTTAADGEGRIELTGLPAGPWRVRVQGGSAPAAADVAESAEFTDLRL